MPNNKIETKDRIIKNLSSLRRLIALGNRIQDRCLEDDAEPEKIIADIYDEIRIISGDDARMKQIVERTVARTKDEADINLPVAFYLDYKLRLCL